MKLKIREQKNQRTTEEDELVKLIRESGTISRRALNLLTGSLARNKLNRMVKSNVVKSATFGRRSLLYVNKEPKLSNFDDLELIGLGAYFMRDTGYKLGPATLLDDSVSYQTINGDTLSYLTFKSINLSNYKEVYNNDDDNYSNTCYVYDSSETFNVTSNQLPTSLLKRGLIVITINKLNGSYQIDGTYMKKDDNNKLARIDLDDKDKILSNLSTIKLPSNSVAIEQIKQSYAMRGLNLGGSNNE